MSDHPAASVEVGQNERRMLWLMTAQQPADAPMDDLQQQGLQQHDFDVQKQLHQQIRNDPDYDDWEYGTEPLPHEAWVARQASKEAGSAPEQAAS
ncbi:MAG: hypothetical protein RLZZ346_1747 [Cyanobacteriota bacterium]